MPRRSNSPDVKRPPRAVALLEQSWRAPFLAALRNSGNVRAACQAAGVSRQYVYAQRVADPTLDKEWNEASEDAVDVLAAEARRRAMTDSDTLLIYLLKVQGGDEWRRDRQPLEINVDARSVNLTQLTDEQLARLADGR